MVTATTPKVRSFSEAAKEANLPIVVDRDFIADLGPVVWTGARLAEAKNPQTGEMGKGLMAEIATDSGDHYLSFIGNVALLQVIGIIGEDEELAVREDIFPFRATIKKSGRTWVFSD